MKKLLFLVFLPLLIACSSEVATESFCVQKTHETQVSHEVTLENALKRVEPLFSALGGKTRSDLKVASVEYISAIGTETRSSGDSVLYYLVNYDNQEGFALLGADDRIYPVLAISTEGNMAMGDTVSNRGLASFFRSVTWNPPLIPDTLVKPGDPLYLIQLKSIIKPKLSDIVSKWDKAEITELISQEYGAMDELIKGTTLSMVQIMSYFGRPLGVEMRNDFPFLEKHVNWPAARNYPVNSNINNPLIELFYRLEQDMEGDIDYPVAMALPYTFRYWGYESPYYGDPLDRLTWPNFGGSESMADALDDGNLVQAFGVEKSNGNYCVWTIDGYMKYIYPSQIAPKYEDTVNLLHCVWGNGGRDNGYFFCRTNEPIDDIMIGPKPEEPDPQTTEDIKPLVWVEFYHYKYVPR